MVETKSEPKADEKHEEHHSHHEHHDNSSVEIPVGRYAEKLRKNPWIVATVVLAIVVLYLLFTRTGGGASGVSVVSEKVAGENLMSFIKTRVQGDVELLSTNRSGELYQVTVGYQGQNIPMYVTLDGKYLIGGEVVPLTGNPATNNNDSDTTPVQQDIPKTDKPKVELFVMSHCPYGTQIEKGMLPVALLLKDKIDFQIKFVYYAMHGEKEVKEQLSQYCIMSEQKDKYLNYLKCFLTDETSGDKCLTNATIDRAKLNTCINKTDAQYNVMANLKNESSWLSGRFPMFDIFKADNDKYQVGGSPTLIINGVEAQSGRDSPSLLKTICGAFTTEPAECKTVLEAGTPSPGFGWDTTSSNNLATCG